MDGLVYHNQVSIWEAKPKTDSWFQALNAQDKKRKKEKKRTKSITDYTQTIDHMLKS